MKEIRVSDAPGETRLAVLDEGRLSDLILERRTASPDALRVGDIVLAKVAKVVHGAGGVFLDLGEGAQGFMPARAAQPLAKADDDRRRVETFITEGRSLVLQVTKLADDGKGPRLSADVTLPSTRLVLTPRRDKVSFSRRITDRDMRRRLYDAVGEMPEGIGVILRHNATESSDEEIDREIEGLIDRWDTIEEEAENRGKPGRLYTDPAPLVSALRDKLDQDVDKLVIDNGPGTQTMLRWLKKNESLLQGARVETTKPGEAFAQADLDDKIDALLSPIVRLPGGGRLIIEPVTALTAVDVDAGEASGTGEGPEETALKVNREAAEELPRQIRLRGLGGLIVTDFIRMQNSGGRRQVLASLHRGFHGDDAATKVGTYTSFGLVEISRQRSGPPLSALLGTPGSGEKRAEIVKSPETVGLEALRSYLAQTRAGAKARWVIQVPSAVATWFNTHEALLSAEYAAYGLPAPALEENAALSEDSFEITGS